MIEELTSAVFQKHELEYGDILKQTALFLFLANQDYKSNVMNKYHIFYEKAVCLK